MKAIFAALTLIALMGTAQAAELNPAAIKIVTPDEFVWRDPLGAPTNSASLHGDRNAEGEYYVYVNIFQPGQFSRPHFHANDRFITVLKGTWWVSTSTVYDPDNNTVPVPVGSFVTHYGGEIHYDGAKDEEVWVLITGIGPSAGTPAEAPSGGTN